MCIHGYGDGGEHGEHGESDLLEESQPVDAEEEWEHRKDETGGVRHCWVTKVRCTALGFTKQWQPMEVVDVVKAVIITFALEHGIVGKQYRMPGDQ